MWSAAELSDFSCFLILACGVTLLQRTGFVRIYITIYICDILPLDNVLLIFVSVIFCCLRYQLNISHDSWSRNNQIICGVQYFRGE